MIDRIFNILCMAIMVVILSMACSQDGDVAECPVDEVNNLVGFLDGAEGILYVMPDMHELVLNKLGAEPVSDTTCQVDLSAYPGVSGEPVTFELVVTEQPYIYSLKPMPIMSGVSLLGTAKVYRNVTCGKTHPGFKSDCIGIPAWMPERQSYKGMRWSVDPWKSCVDGSDTCKVVYSIVGLATLYPSLDCSDPDSSTGTKLIFGYRCDKKQP